MSTQLQKADQFPAMLDKFKGEIARALPRHMNADRLARIALTCFRQAPALGRCDPKSVFAAVIMASQLGLEPGIGGQAYLIPYGTECQFVPGWQGLVDLVSRAGRASVWTGAVYEGDEFDYALGDSPFVLHKPSGDEDESKLTHVYAIGRIDGAKWPIIEVWPIAKVIRHRDRYNKVGKKHYSFQHLEMYGRKVALLQVMKYMPKSVELQTAIALEHAAEQGTQRIDVKDAIEGTWAPVPASEVPDGVDPKTGEILEPQAKPAYAAAAEQSTPAREPAQARNKEDAKPAAEESDLTDGQEAILSDWLQSSGKTRAEVVKYLGRPLNQESYASAIGWLRRLSGQGE